MTKIRKWALIVVAVMNCIHAARGQFVNAVAPNAPRTLTLTGTVFDPSGAPAPGIVMGTAPRTGLARLPILSDANGKYSLVWQPRPANARPVITFSVIARDLTHNLAAAHIIDEGTTNLDLHLQPGLTISFKVEDPAGNPITNAVARLTVSFANAGMAISNQPPVSNGTRQNRIEFNALPQGYHFNGTVRAPGYGLATLRLPAGLDTHTNLIDLGTVVLKVANLKIAGRVLGPDGKAYAGASVIIFGEGQPSAIVRSDDAGRFAFDACEGPVNVSANAQGANGRSQTTGGDTNVEIKLTTPNNLPAPQQVVPADRPPELLPFGMIPPFRVRGNAGRESSNGQQLDFEDQSGVGRNGSGITRCAVSEFGRDGEPHFVPDPHGRHPLVPALNHLAESESKGKGIIAVHRAVELGPICQPSGVMNGHSVAAFG